MYQCNICSYATDHKSHYVKHNKSKKHIENNNLSCSNCNKQFSSKQYLDRHLEIFCKGSCSQKPDKKNSMIKKLMTTIEIMKIENEKSTLQIENKHLKEMIDTKDKQIEDKDRLNNKLTNLANKSMNVLTYVMTNFPDAPPLEKLENNKILYIGNDNYTSPEIVLHYHKNKKLPKYIGDRILMQCKKKNPKEQSVWNSDVARHSYITKRTASATGWKRDKKGLTVTEYLIDPVLSQTKDEVEEHIKKLKDELANYTDKTTTRGQYIVKHVPIFYEIISEIDGTTLATEVIKYISPKLQLTFNTALIDVVDSDKDDDKVVEQNDDQDNNIQEDDQEDNPVDTQTDDE